MGLARERDVFIANVVKCRPPANRTPEPVECASCMPYLERQIALIQPRVIVALGRVAAQSLLGSPSNLGSLRGQVHDRAGIPLVVTYHPAYLLRNLTEKSRAWVDLCLALRVMSERNAVGSAVPADPPDQQ
jgi:DNA polymerase